MKADPGKIVVVLITAILAMGAWYLREVTFELRLLREQVFQARMETYRLAVAIEIEKGGNPETVLVPTRPTKGD